MGRKKIYQDIDFNLIVYCQCGCGKRIVLKKHHKRVGIPKFILGHNFKTNQFRKFISNVNTGRVHSLEHRLKNSLGNKGKIKSEEHKRKLSGSLMNHAVSEETKNKISIGNTGKKRSEEQIKKSIIGRINNGTNKRTLEQKEKMRKSAIDRIIKYGGNFGGFSHRNRGSFYSHKSQKEIRYESSLELGAYLMLENSSKVKSYDRCKFSIDYTFKDELHKYIPDIDVIYTDNTREILEIKPEQLLKDEQNMAKFNAAKDYCDKNKVI